MAAVLVVVGGLALLLSPTTETPPANTVTPTTIVVPTTLVPTVVVPTTVAPEPPFEPPVSVAGLISPDRWTLAAVDELGGSMTEYVDDVQAWEGVVDIVVIPPDPESWNAVTGLPDTCTDEPLPEIPCGEGIVVLLDDNRDPGPVVWRLKSELGLFSVLSSAVSQSLVDEYVSSMSLTSAAPEPQFDTASLGIEHPLVGPLSPDTLSPQFTEPSEFPRLWFSAARPDGSSFTGAFWIEKEASPSGDYETLNLRLGVGTESEGGGYGTSVNWAGGLVVAMVQESIFAIGGLPPEASVVTTSLDDGAVAWQHPVNGLALFELPLRAPAVFKVLDATGEEILQVEVGTIRGYRVIRSS